MVDFVLGIMQGLQIDKHSGMPKILIENIHIKRDQRVEFYIQDLVSFKLHHKKKQLNNYILYLWSTIMGAMVPPSRKSCYNFRVTEINRVVDGDTIDVTIDLGFDLYKKERVRVAGVDTPEKRTRDLEEKALGLDATNWMKEKLEGAIDGDDELTIRTELKGGMGKYGRLLGWLYVGDDDVSLNEKMIIQGYAWSYDGGTKQKNFEELREIRRSFGTLMEG